MHLKEIEGNIWDYYNKGNWIVITTNGTVKKDGTCVMGRGVALQAKRKYDWLPDELGRRIKNYGNKVYFFTESRLITLPVKHNWWEKADINLIESSLLDLVRLIEWCKEYSPIKVPIYMVRPGCSNGRLDWKDVKPVLEKYLDDRFIIVNNE